MNIVIFDQLNKILETYCGLRYEYNRMYLLASGVNDRKSLLKIDTDDDYVHHLQSSQNELKHLTECLTINETFFFRDQQNFTALRHYIIPEIIQHKSSCHILSAACSTGEEPYSIAIMMKKNFPHINTHIDAIDIDQQALTKAKAGSYPIRAFHNTHPDIMSTYFKQHHNEYILDTDIRHAVNFIQGNLLDQTLYHQLAMVDVILCRNVFIYFSQETIQKVIHHFEQLMKPGGFMLLGHAENIREIDSHFELMESHQSFFYQFNHKMNQSTHNTIFVPDVKPINMASISVSKNEVFNSNVDASINSDTTEKATVNKQYTLNIDQTLEKALTFFEQKKTAIAAHEFDKILEISPQHILAQLGVAIIAASRGECEHARTICQNIIKLDKLSVEVYYVLGAVEEIADNLNEAKKAYQSSLFLDNNFALSHYRMGLIFQRQNNKKRALKSIKMTLKNSHLIHPILFRLSANGETIKTISNACLKYLADNDCL